MNATIEQFITELRKNPDVLGILLFGSRARGNNRDDSDVDLLVIVKHGFHRIIEERANLAFEIIFTTEDQAISFWRANPDDQRNSGELLESCLTGTAQCSGSKT